MKTKTNTNIVVLHFKQIFIYKKKKKIIAGSVFVTYTRCLRFYLFRVFLVVTMNHLLRVVDKYIVIIFTAYLSPVLGACLLAVSNN